MLPDFNDDGNLPPGIHRATIEEVATRFGHGSQEREVEARELVDFVAWARKAQVRRLLSNGSFTGSTRTPNDVDIVILPSAATVADRGYRRRAAGSWPFLHIFIAVDDADFAQWAEFEFATDRRGRQKGVVEILL